MQKTIFGFIVLTSLFLIGYEYLGMDSQKKEAAKESTNKVVVGAATKLVFDDKNITQEEEALFDTNDSKDKSLQNYKDHNRTAEKVTAKKKVVTSKLVPAKSAVSTDKEFRANLQQKKIVQANSKTREEVKDVATSYQAINLNESQLNKIESEVNGEYRVHLTERQLNKIESEVNGEYRVHLTERQLNKIESEVNSQSSVKVSDEVQKKIALEVKATLDMK